MILNQDQIKSLFESIKHGDQDHHDWLLEAIAAWSCGQPIPPVRGQGKKEAEIARLKAQVADLDEKVSSFEDRLRYATGND